MFLYGTALTVWHTGEESPPRINVVPVELFVTGMPVFQVQIPAVPVPVPVFSRASDLRRAGKYNGGRVS